MYLRSTFLPASEVVVADCTDVFVNCIGEGSESPRVDHPLATANDRYQNVQTFTYFAGSPLRMPGRLPREYLDMI